MNPIRISAIIVVSVSSGILYLSLINLFLLKLASFLLCIMGLAMYNVVILRSVPFVHEEIKLIFKELHDKYLR